MTDPINRLDLLPQHHSIIIRATAAIYGWTVADVTEDDGPGQRNEGFTMDQFTRATDVITVVYSRAGAISTTDYRGWVLNTEYPDAFEAALAALTA